MDLKKLIISLRNLNMPTGDFAIFGSGPMAIRGLKKPSDLDVIVTKKLYNQFKITPGWIEKSFNSGKKYYLEKNGIELWNDWGPGYWNIPQLIATAEIIDGLPYVTLDNVLLWKMKNGRQKDIDDITVIKKFLQNPLHHTLRT